MGRLLSHLKHWQSLSLFVKVVMPVKMETTQDLINKTLLRVTSNSDRYTVH